MLPKTGEAAARAAVDRRRAHLAEQPDTQLNLSIGLTVGPEGRSLLEVMHELDHAMSRDKLNRRKGRLAPASE